MADPLFHRLSVALTVGEIAVAVGAETDPSADLTRRISNIADLDRAGPADLALVDHVAHRQGARPMSHAGACIVSAAFRDQISPRSIALVVADPYRVFVDVAHLLFPEANRPSSLSEAAGIAPGADIHPSARFESGVTIEPGAAIGANVEIGAETFVGAATVITSDVRIGRGCTIGPNASISNALIGDRVTLRAGCRIGQDGFGFTAVEPGYRVGPHLGRVIIQDNVVVGAGTIIDRGFVGDTVIGEGSKIDSLVTIARNTNVGRQCIIVAQVGIAEGATLEDHVVIGARAVVASQIMIGEAARVAAASVVLEEVPARSVAGREA